MSVETWFRILFAIIALGMAVYLVASLVTGRSRVGGRSVDRRAAPRIYWGSLGKIAILMTGLAVTLLLPPGRDALPVVFLGLVGGQLFEMFVAGTVQMPGVAYARAAQPRTYWRWVAFHAAIVILLLVFLVVQSRSATTIL
jgi:hypothetical protein